MRKHCYYGNDMNAKQAVFITDISVAMRVERNQNMA